MSLSEFGEGTIKETKQKNKYIQSPGRGLLLFFFIFFLFISCFNNSHAKEIYKTKNFKVKLKGYLKTLWVFIDDNTTDTGYTQNVNRLRLQTDAFYKENLKLRLIYDMEGITGNIVSTPMWSQLKNDQVYSYWDLTSGKYLNSSTYIRHSLYRAYLYYDAKFAQFTLGKQRVAWGVMRFWRPTDMFNPETPLQIEPGERLGIDAIHMSMPLGAGNIEGLYSQSRLPGYNMGAGKYHFTLGEYDIGVIGGKIRENNVAGFTFDGYIGNGGFRGEAARIKPDFKDAYYLWSVGGDYSFKKLTLTLEYLNNGGATGSPIDPFEPNPGLIRTRRKQFVGLSAVYDVTPLIKFNGFVSRDIDGGSTAFSPRINWNYAENVEISIGGVFYNAKPGSEYEGYPTTYLGDIKYYF
ncbi:MAG: hypothetical protein K8T10_20925 [Candidatus Eremiobacteraeota bacterium]|nr:hypothetical protein [Candidatus Eremiobacteraeota bacterium]